jgi:hypothetical protein
VLLKHSFEGKNLSYSRTVYFTNRSFAGHYVKHMILVALIRVAGNIRGTL